MRLYSNKHNGKDASFIFKISWSRDTKRLSLIFNWNSELLKLRTSTLTKETMWSFMRMWSLTAVDFIDLDSLFIKGGILDCSSTFTSKW